LLAIVCVILLAASGCGSDDAQQQTSDTEPYVQLTTDLESQADEQQEPDSNSLFDEQQVSEVDSQAGANPPLTLDNEISSQAAIETEPSLDLSVSGQLVARNGINHELMIPSSWDYQRGSFFDGFRITFGETHRFVVTSVHPESSMTEEPNFVFDDGVTGFYSDVLDGSVLVSFTYPLSDGGIILLEVHYISREDLNWFYANEELILAIGRSLTHNGQRAPLPLENRTFLPLEMSINSPVIGHELRGPFAWMFGQRWQNGEPNGFWINCGVDGIQIFTYIGVLDWEYTSYDAFTFIDGVEGKFWVFPDDNTFVLFRYPFGHRRENLYFFAQFDDDVDITWFYEHARIIHSMAATLTVR